LPSLTRSKDSSLDGARKSLDEVLEEAILARVRELGERLAEEREVMSPQEAADFLHISLASFKRIAPTLPRCPVTERCFVYLREDLMEWLRERRI
jgi:hypothetical protein